jgi:hypothetical protein
MINHNLDILLRRIALISGTDQGSGNAPQLSLPMESESALFEEVRALLNVGLTDDELRVVSLLYCHRQWFDLVQPTRSKVPQILTSLREKGIVEVESLPDNIIEETLIPPIVFLNKEALRKADCSNNESEQSKPFESVREYALAFLNLSKRFFTFRDYERSQHPIHGLINERSSRKIQSQTDTERKLDQDHRTLINRANLDWERYPMERLVRRLALDDNARLILFYVLLSELENDSVAVEDLITLVSVDVFDRMGKERYLKPSSPLRLYDLITVDDSRRRMRFQTKVQMRESVQKWLMTGEGCIRGVSDSEDSEPYSSEYEHIEDWISYASTVVRIAKLSGSERRYDDDEDDALVDEYEGYSVTNHPLLKAMKTRIAKRTAASTRSFPLDRVQERFKLTAMERDLLVLILQSATTGRDLTLDSLSAYFSTDAREQQRISALLDPDQPLIKNGLVLVTPHLRSAKFLELSLPLRNYLLGVSDAFETSAQVLTVNDPILSVMHPTCTWDSLVLPPDIMLKFRTAQQRYLSNSDTLLKQWGIIPSTESSTEHESIGSLCMILSGESGTGKSMASHGFAQRLKKDLVYTSCSKLIDCYVGETEKNISKLFLTYRSIVQRSTNFPILLLDEADGILGKRSASAERGVDRMYHNVQTLLLTMLQPDMFCGICIATTNLIDAIDPAFSRRFDLKIVFPMPDATARLKIWKKHLPPTVPLAGDVDLSALADQYEFSGGQIAVAVKNAATTAAIRGDMIRMGDLVAACRAEAEGAFDSKSTSRKRQVGFISPDPDLRMQERVHLGR